MDRRARSFTSPEMASELGGKHVVLDVTDDASVSVAAETVARGGGLDVLVNNAGIAGATTRR
jgi:NAD(P)-dependent dehydrogenase (short-subunit alcohol dehydrogenase family)